MTHARLLEMLEPLLRDSQAIDQLAKLGKWFETFHGPLTMKRVVAARDSLREQVEIALNLYAGTWEPGMPIPHGFMECDGERPAGPTRGTSGPHLRRYQRSAERSEFLIRRVVEPVTEPGEEAIWLASGALVPTIVRRPA